MKTYTVDPGFPHEHPELHELLQVLGEASLAFAGVPVVAWLLLV